VYFSSTSSSSCCICSHFRCCYSSRSISTTFEVFQQSSYEFLPLLLVLILVDTHNRRHTENLTHCTAELQLVFLHAAEGIRSLAMTMLAVMMIAVIIGVIIVVIIIIIKAITMPATKTKAIG